MNCWCFQTQHERIRNHRVCSTPPQSCGGRIYDFPEGWRKKGKAFGDKCTEEKPGVCWAQWCMAIPGEGLRQED